MPSKVKLAEKKKLITPPSWLAGSIQYEIITGSVAYGVSTDYSDVDIYGWCIPEKETIFPHLAGHIEGFGTKPQKFEQYQQHHVLDKETKKEYDFSIYGIVKYFQLCMENNPNMIDTLYVPDFCIQHITEIGKMVRENRDHFLHKGSKFKFLGYAFSQLHKMKNKNPEGKRKDLVDKFGYDVKYGAHLVRLLYEGQQILEEGTLDLQRHREHLKAVRAGEVPEDTLISWAKEKELYVEKLYTESKLRHSPDEDFIKNLMLNCLEQYYGSLDNAIDNSEKKYKILIEQIKKIVINA